MLASLLKGCMNACWCCFPTPSIAFTMFKEASAPALQGGKAGEATKTLYLASIAADGRILFWDCTFVLTQERWGAFAAFLGFFAYVWPVLSTLCAFYSAAVSSQGSCSDALVDNVQGRGA